MVPPKNMKPQTAKSAQFINEKVNDAVDAYLAEHGENLKAQFKVSGATPEEAEQYLAELKLSIQAEMLKLSKKEMGEIQKKKKLSPR